MRIKPHPIPRRLLAYSGCRRSKRTCTFKNRNANKDDQSSSVISAGLLLSCAYLLCAMFTSVKACMTQWAVHLFASVCMWVWRGQSWWLWVMLLCLQMDPSTRNQVLSRSKKLYSSHRCRVNITQACLRGDGCVLEGKPHVHRGEMHMRRLFFFRHLIRKKNVAFWIWLTAIWKKWMNSWLIETLSTKGHVILQEMQYSSL